VRENSVDSIELESLKLAEKDLEFRVFET